MLRYKWWKLIKLLLHIYYFLLSYYSVTRRKFLTNSLMARWQPTFLKDWFSRHYHSLSITVTYSNIRSVDACYVVPILTFRFLCHETCYIGNHLVLSLSAI